MNETSKTLKHLSQSDLDDLEYIINASGGNDKIMLYLNGSGFTSDILKKVRGWLSPCLCYGKSTKQTLGKYGKYYIESIQIYRTPLANILNIALQGLTFGKWYSLMKEFGFDKFYHLALVATININGKNKNIIIEKNETINISTSYKTNKETETYPVQMGIRRGKITLHKLMQRTLDNVGDEKYYLYNAFSNNCQYFIRYILESNGMLDEKAEKFLFQDINQLAAKLPSYIKKTARAVTDVAATTSKLLGKGNHGDIGLQNSMKWALTNSNDPAAKAIFQLNNAIQRL